MLKTYLKMAWRAIAKNKISSFINIGGLSIGLATGIIVLLVIVDEFSFDRFHPKLDRLHLLMRNQDFNGGIYTNRVTSGLIGPVVKNEIPGITDAARITGTDQQLLRAGDKTLYQAGLYADPSLFRMMHFPATSGDPVKALSEPGNIVLSESAARRLFGTSDAVGKLLMHNSQHALKVGAVIKDIPHNSTISFEVALPFVLLESESPWLQKWDDNRVLTWIETAPNTDLAALNGKLKKLFLEKQAEQNTDLFAYPLAKLRLYGHFVNGKPKGGAIDIILLMAAIGISVLLIACINFMNLATAGYQKRSKEVGVSKVLGASRPRIILQFLSEAVLLSLFALGIAAALAYFVLPVFMAFVHKQFTPVFSNWQMWALLIALGLITGLIAGSYPAFYLSSFQPVKVLRKNIDPGKGSGLFRKALVTVQFIISIFLVIATIVIFKQVEHVRNRPVGYQPENLISIQARAGLQGQYALVKRQLEQIPGVVSVSAGSDNVLRFNAGLNDLQWPGRKDNEDFMITLTSVHYDWTKTVGVQIVEGRDFSPVFGTDTAACLINEAAAKRMRLEKPVGAKLNDNTVIGVMKDFLFNDPAGAVKPMMVTLNKGAQSNFFVRVINDGQWRGRIAAIEKSIKGINPDYPFEFHFVDEQYEDTFDTARSIGQMANTFGAMAIFISCLGLFGLSAFLAQRRNKEMNIRKILGADARLIWFTLSKDFLKPVLIAFLVAVPLAAWLLQKALSMMEYHISLAWWMFALAGAAALLVALGTVSFHGIRAAIENPARALKSE